MTHPESGGRSRGFVGATWQAADIGGAAALDGVRSTVTFTEDGHLQGDGGVNRFRGGYRLLGATIEFGGIAATKMAGPEAAMRQEERFLASLSGTRAFSHAGDELVIGEGAAAVTLQRADRETGDGEQLTVSGTVTYRQRIALPADAVVTVRLLDVSRADAPSVTLAEQVIKPTHQVPIPFSLTVERSALDPRHSYSVSARITEGDRLAWISDTNHPVVLDGPNQVDIVVAMVPSSGDVPG